MNYLRERSGQAHELLFVTVRGQRPYAPQVLRKLIRAAAKRAKITKRVYPHLLRHSLATNMLNRGANILMIKDQLGHAFVETTMIYLHAARERIQKCLTWYCFPDNDVPYGQSTTSASCNKQVSPDTLLTIPQEK